MRIALTGQRPFSVRTLPFWLSYFHDSPSDGWISSSSLKHYFCKGVSITRYISFILYKNVTQQSFQMVRMQHDRYFFYTKDSSPLRIRNLESVMDLGGYDLACRSNEKQKIEAMKQLVVKPWNSLIFECSWCTYHKFVENLLDKYKFNHVIICYYRIIKPTMITLFDQTTETI